MSESASGIPPEVDQGSDKSAIRNAATVVLWRCSDRPEVLMGQRGAKAAFMPSKFVFPGGAVDAEDAVVPLSGLPDPVCMNRLREDSIPDLASALVAAAVRETWEETGLVLGRTGDWENPPPDWREFAATGHRPDGTGLTFVFRAITPPGRPRRFDARFFLAKVDAIQGNPDDFTRASDELSALQWIPLDKVRQFDLPFITEVVLAEVAALLRTGTRPKSVPFFRNDDEESLLLRLNGAPPEPQSR